MPYGRPVQHLLRSKGLSEAAFGMAEVLMAAGPLLSAGASVYGGIQDDASNAHDRENAARSGTLARQQNARLMQGGAPMPAYTESPQGYGMPTDASGQYAQTSAPMMQPQFTDGPPQAVQGAAQGYMPTQQLPPDPIQGAYMQGLYDAQQQMQPNVFGVPVWFDDGQQNG